MYNVQALPIREGKEKIGPRPPEKRIPISEPFLGGNEWKYIKDCLDTGWVSSVGKYVNLFEEKMAEYTGAKFAVSTVNGTAALHTALLVAGVKPGDRVIVPTLTFIATVNPVIYCGAIPVFVDSEEKTLNMDPMKTVQKIQELIARQQDPKAIIVTHLYGHPCDMDPILEIAGEQEIPVIEDACESLGSKYKGKMTGVLGDIGCLSFNGNKIITTGGGGMILTNNSEFAERARYLTTQARDDATEYVHKEIGYNYRLTNLAAAVGVAQLEQLPMILKRKRGIAKNYEKALAEIPGIRYMAPQPWAESNCWLNTVLLSDHGTYPAMKSLIQNLAKEGVEARPVFSPIHLQECFEKYRDQKLSVSERCVGLNLPSSFSLSDEDVLRVAGSLLESGRP